MKRKGVTTKSVTTKGVTARSVKAKSVTAKRVTTKAKAKRAPIEPLDDVRVRGGRVYDKLTAEYPDAHCELDFKNPFQLIVATILSAQCTDRRVNMVTPVLFSRYPSPVTLARAKQEDVERIIQSTGFFRNKAKNLIAMSRALVDHYGSEVPAKLEDLVTLPGVGRKTGNVVLGNAFRIDEGVVVDTHIARLSLRLGFTKATDPLKIEQDLIGLFPRERWTMLAHLLIWHGRRVCDARKPRHKACAVAHLCPSRNI